MHENLLLKSTINKVEQPSYSGCSHSKTKSQRTITTCDAEVKQGNILNYTALILGLKMSTKVFIASDKNEEGSLILITLYGILLIHTDSNHSMTIAHRNQLLITIDPQ